MYRASQKQCGSMNSTEEHAENHSIYLKFEKNICVLHKSICIAFVCIVLMDHIQGITKVLECIGLKIISLKFSDALGI